MFSNPCRIASSIGGRIGVEGLAGDVGRRVVEIEPYILHQEVGWRDSRQYIGIRRRRPTAFVNAAGVVGDQRHGIRRRAANYMGNVLFARQVK